MSALLDTARPLETPEGVDLTLVLAGPVPRALAWVLDLLIRIAIYSVAAQVLLVFGGFGGGILMILIFLTEWFYPVLFEVYRHGQTLGKSALQIAVVREDGTAVTWTESIIRNLLRAADILPGCFGVALVSMAVSPRFQRLGDLAAGTLVVHRVPPAPLSQTREAGEAAPPPLPLDLEEQRAILDFADRIPLLSAERAEELAAIPAPVLCAGHEPIPALQAMARWFRGRANPALPE